MTKIARKPPTPRAVAGALARNAAKSGYSITPAERDEYLDLQEHRCATCLRPFRVPAWHLVCTYHGKVTGRRIFPVMVDHDHKTGAVRGLLCNWCNHKLVPLFERHLDTMNRVRWYVEDGGI